MLRGKYRRIRRNMFSTNRLRQENEMLVLMLEMLVLVSEMLALMIKTNCLLPQALQGPVTAERSPSRRPACGHYLRFSSQLRDALRVEPEAITGRCERLSPQ
jgi:hypothetical protein